MNTFECTNGELGNRGEDILPGTDSEYDTTEANVAVVDIPKPRHITQEDVNECVLNIAPLDDLGIDIATVNKLLKKNFNDKKVFRKIMGINNLKLDDLYDEYLLVESISGSDYVGSGNTPIDIKTKAIGIDSFAVTLNGNKNYTNEKSLGQNFKSVGTNLDNLFISKGYKEIKKQFLKFWKTNKHDSTLKKYGLSQMNYVGFISTKNAVYLLNLKIDIQNIDKLTVGKTNKKSFSLDHFINPEYGHVTIYKSKKRLELRLNKSVLEHKYCRKIFDITELDNTI